MHSGEAGGDPNSGSAGARGAVEENPLDALTPEQKARLQSVGRAMDEAQQDLRDGTVDPKLLKDLGMTNEEFRQFVKDYTDRFGQIGPRGDTTVRPDQLVTGAVALPGSDELQRGHGAGGNVSDVEGGEKLTPDEVRKLAQSKAAEASPEYRKHVEAYLRAISEEAPAASQPGK